MEDISHPHEPTPNLEQLSRGELIERHRMLNEATDEILRQIVEQQDDDLQVLLDDVAARYDPERSGNYYGVLIEHGEGILPEAYLELLRTLERNLTDIMTIDALLRDPGHGDGEYARYIRNEARQLLERVDYRHLRSSHYSEDDRQAIDKALNALERVSTEPDLTETKADDYYDLIEQRRALLEALRVFSEDSGELTLATQDSVYTEAELARAYHLNTRYRGDDPDRLYPEEAAEHVLLPTHDWQVHLTDDQRHHLERYLQSLDSAREIERLEIEGLNLLPFTVDATAIRELLRNIPAIAFEGVEKVIFRAKTPEEVAAEQGTFTEGWVVTAVHSHDLETNQADITYWVDPLARQLQKRLAEMPKPTTVAEVEAQQAWVVERSMASIEKSLVHEFGHAFHAKLPVSMLHAWDTLVDTLTQSQQVSEYLEQILVEETSNYYVEDFAESFQLYLVKPDILRERSAERYALMHEIITSTRGHLK